MDYTNLDELAKQIETIETPLAKWLTTLIQIIAEDYNDDTTIKNAAINTAIYYLIENGGLNASR